MRLPGCSVFSAALVAAGCAGKPAPQTIYVVRHFDTPEGVKDARLTPQGEARAASLARKAAKSMQ